MASRLPSRLSILFCSADSLGYEIADHWSVDALLDSLDRPGHRIQQRPQPLDAHVGPPDLDRNVVEVKRYEPAGCYPVHMSARGIAIASEEREKALAFLVLLHLRGREGGSRHYLNVVASGGSPRIRGINLTDSTVRPRAQKPCMCRVI